MQMRSIIGQQPNVGRFFVSPSVRHAPPNLAPRYNAIKASQPNQEASCPDEPSLPADNSLPPSRRAVVGTAALTSLLQAATAPAAGSSTTSPSPVEAASRVREARMVMRVTALRGSVPQQWVADFATAMEGYGTVAMGLKPQISDIWQDLTGETPQGTTSKKWRGKGGKNNKKGKITTVDAVSLGGAWLQAAIAKKAIQPLKEPKQHRYWAALPPRMRQLVIRSPSTGMPSSSGGQAWGVPYRWGCTLILYRKDKCARWGGRPICDWDDLLHPALKNRVAFVDSPRELIGAALKTLGLGYNATAADLATCGVSESDLATRVQRLAGQVKVFSSVDHVRALSAGEVDVVVGWSDDLLPLAKRNNNADLAVPSSGTALWSDVWCVPAGAAGGAENGEPSPLLPAWLELGLQPIRAQRSRGLQGGASPLLLPPAEPMKRGVCAPMRVANADALSALVGGVMPSDDVLSCSEFLLPLDSETAALYRRVITL